MNKRRILLGVGMLVLLVLVGAYFARRNAVRELTLAGLVDANEVVVTPSVQARIDTLWVDEGSTVHAGDPIATLDQRELAAQASSAGASTASVRAQLDQAATDAEQVAGVALANQTAARARLAADSADLIRQTAELHRLRNAAARTRALEQGGAVSPAQLEEDTTAARVQQQLVASAGETLRAGHADVRNADASALAASAARSNVVASRARLRGAEADSVAAGIRLGYTELRAPVSGVVQVLVARRGELVGPGSPVAVIIDPDHLWVRVAAPESDAGAVAVGDSLPVQFPDGEMLRGQVISKSVEADFATQHDVSASKRDVRAVAFRVAIPNPRHTIVTGMSANVILPVGHP